MVNWLHCYEGQKEENEILKVFHFKKKTEEHIFIASD